ncbi:MAG: 2-C-methyl-D-erythritol 4-phosphate cytidylyltransferase [Oscillospiraceae bacterium]|jgi:2-C-methyl-D-erythritol 4-phosphate cytidylyltransferase|nr:2-C-methyl-D-erythritol 4-phosphate cytidylyltransferase [Oscillospiraceae bacterium]
MVIAAVLAGGIGSRMGNSALPKQFLPLGSKPVIIHTIEKFLVHPQVDQVVVLCPRAWVGYTQDLMREQLPGEPRAAVAEGGETRNDTLRRALDYAAEQFGTQEDHLLLTHDAVRPFVTHRIISENIAAAAAYGACDTVIPATDTIVQSADGQTISVIPDRKTMFQGQTPQSFRVNKLRELMASLTAEEQEILTDACKIYALRGEPVALVAGETYNMKITYPFDLKVAQSLLNLEGTAKHD